MTWTFLFVFVVVIALLVPRPWGLIFVLVYLVFVGRRFRSYLREHQASTPQRKRTRQILWASLVILLVIGVAKFYHYNYVENTPGQSRRLLMPGLKKFVCKGEVFKPTGIDHCGKRSIWSDNDWGITAYVTIYGVETKEEAVEIAQFMNATRKKNEQERIPINLKVYSLPRSAGGFGPVSSKYIIYDEHF